MKNIKLLIEFDGTDFFGWQRQADHRTVQGDLEAVVADLFGEPVAVTGAGRTDAGVHALGYVCNFRVDTHLDPPTIGKALTTRLPADVAIRGVEEVPPSFNARRSAIARRYAYHIVTRPTAVDRRTRWYVRYPLDAGRMAQAVGVLAGEHDFSTFVAGGGEAVSPVCTVTDIGVSARGELIAIHIDANRFLYHMVRNIVGTLVDIGRGRHGPEHMGVILGKRDRRVAGPTAPAHGLTLVEVRYPD